MNTVYLFRTKKDGYPLYVGCTIHPERRRREHIRRLPQLARTDFIVLALCSDRQTALEIEARYIRRLQPSFNDHGIRDRRRLRAIFTEAVA